MTKERICPLTVGIVVLLHDRKMIPMWNIMLAGSSIALFPIIALYSFTDRYFVTGITNGVLKE